LNNREWAYLVPIVIFIVWIGVYPKFFLNYSEKTVKSVVSKVHTQSLGNTSTLNNLNLLKNIESNLGAKK